MKTRILAILLCVAVLISITACGAEAGNDPSSEDLWNPGISQRSVLKKEGALFGVLYIGYAESDMNDLEANRGYYEKMFEDTTSADKFPFLKNVPDSQFVSTDMGHDLYLIIPTDPSATVEIRQMKLEGEDDFNLIAEKTLYKSKNGAPVLLQCNFSDIYSDAEVTVTGPEGESVSWNPFISLRDGRVQINDDEKVYDFTEYEYSE